MSRSFLIATSWFDTPISHQFRALAVELSGRGHRVCVIIDGARALPDGADGVPMIRTWPSPRPVRWKDLVFLRQLIRETEADTLLANFGSVNTMLLGGRSCGVRHRVAWYHTLSRQIALDHGTTAVERMRVLRKRHIYRLATQVVAVSSAARSDCAEAYKVPLSRITVQHPGLRDVLPPAEPCHRSGVVCPGRLHWSKGQDVLVRALALLPEVHATFLGEGPERPHLEELADAVGVRERCRFSGSVDSDQIYKAMAAAEVSVVPSRAEAFGFTSLESMACGTPVVASATGGLREIVRDDIDGVLVPPDDPPATARAIRRCIESRSEMGGAGRMRYLSEFELQVSTRRLADWLEEL